MKWLLLITLSVFPRFLLSMETAATKNKAMISYVIAKIKCPSAEMPNYSVDSITTISVTASAKKGTIRDLVQQQGWTPQQIRASSAPCLLWWYPEDAPQDSHMILYNGYRNSPVS